eukprot:m.237638 g.237638  ORF g.237638 m.237638 type:complete len:105 (-) comp21256_c0_seq1:131-445(-)
MSLSRVARRFSSAAASAPLPPPITKSVVAGREPVPVAVTKGKTYFWCSCGLSKKQPLCDGAHKNNTTFKPIKFIAEEDAEIWFCACKQTSGAPLCDGTHATLKK